MPSQRKILTVSKQPSATKQTTVVKPVKEVPKLEMVETEIKLPQATQNSQRKSDGEPRYRRQETVFVSENSSDDEEGKAAKKVEDPTPGANVMVI